MNRLSDGVNGVEDFLAKVGTGLLMSGEFGGRFMDLDHVLILVSVSNGRNAQGGDEDGEKSKED